MKIYIGLDPGAISGAWGAIDSNSKFIGCGDILSIDGRISAIDLYRNIKQCVPAQDAGQIAIESVHGMKGQGIASTSKFMRAAGAIEATAELTGYQFVLVTPQKWKKFHGLIGAVKESSLELARCHFPTASLKRKKDHGRADALLMALWLKEAYE